jgi:arsenite-transporting ATPase
VLGPAGELWAAEIAAEAALGRWLAAQRPALELVAERGTYLDAQDVRTVFDLTPPGADELGGLLELVRLAEASGCEQVVVDTAPTAHTLRLLQVPELLARLAAAFAHLQEKHRWMAERFGGAYRPDEGDRAIAAIAAQAGRLGELLRGGERAGFVWMLLPESLAVAETADALRALDASGVAVSEVVINRVLPAGGARGARGAGGGDGGPGGALCPLCRRRRAAEATAIAAARRAFAGRGLRLLPDAWEEPRGLAALRRMGAWMADPSPGAGLAGKPGAAGALQQTARTMTAATAARPARTARQAPGAPGAAGATAWKGGPVPPWVEELGARRLLLFGGKGGVGKTTCAAAAAVTIAARWPDEPLLLVSTDPAHSLADVLAAPLDDRERQVAGAPRNLWARELDAPAALARWRGQHRAVLGEVLGGLTAELPEESGAGGRGPEQRDGGPGGVAGGAAGDLLELVPTGLDELVGVLALVDALLAEPGEGAARGEKEAGGAGDSGARPLPSVGRAGGGYARVVVDTAPTGHMLRLVAMPELALAWDHALLSILLKYREAAPPGELAAELVSLSRRLKRFSALLRDRRSCRFVAVARAAELPWRETARMMAALAEMGIEVGTLVVNAVTPPGGGAAGGRCARCRPGAAVEAPYLARLAALTAGASGPRAGAGEGCAMILAPAEYPPPRGARRLGEWGQSWKADRS